MSLPIISGSNKVYSSYGSDIKFKSIKVSNAPLITNVSSGSSAAASSGSSTSSTTSGKVEPSISSTNKLSPALTLIQQSVMDGLKPTLASCKNYYDVSWI